MVIPAFARAGSALDGTGSRWRLSAGPKWLVAPSAIWSAIAPGTNFDMISTGIVKEINTFGFETCKEAGVELEPH